MWNTTYHHIGIRIEDRVVRVLNDTALKRYLTADLRNALYLARHIKCEYRAVNHKPLRISTRSLAVELWAHYIVQEMALLWKRLCKYFLRRQLLSKQMDYLLLHMEVIDCGERDLDSNRIIWDILSLTRP